MPLLSHQTTLSNQTTLTDSSTSIWSDSPLAKQPDKNHQARFIFHGTGAEYFKIWLTNIVLTLLTLTLYSPWAKVRRLRYFYGNTELHQRRFDYTGVPKRILIGRLIALGFYGLFVLSSQFSDQLSVILVGLFMLLTPWLVRSSMRFQARNSKYENIRFYFSASLAKTYGVFIGCILITLFTLGLLYPLAFYWFKRYQFDHLYVGQNKFKLNADIGALFAAIWLPILAYTILVCVALIIFLLPIITQLRADGDIASAFTVTMAIIGGLLYLGALLYLRPLIQGYLYRVIWGNVQIGNNSLTTDCNPWRYAWIQLINQIAIIFSLGLLYPWANIRLYRYKVQSLIVTFVDDPQQLINQAQHDYQAIGEEIADVFDLDISL